MTIRDLIPWNRGRDVDVRCSYNDPFLTDKWTGSIGTVEPPCI